MVAVFAVVADGEQAHGQVGVQNASILVNVNAQNAAGEAWDAFGGAPDIAICVNSALGQRCYANGNGVVNGPAGFARGRCQDAFSCVFVVPVMATGPYSIVVYDVDLSAHDVIGACVIPRMGVYQCGSSRVTAL